MRCVWEHNGSDTLLYSVDHIGAYTRGESLAVAIEKMHAEIELYSLWAKQPHIPMAEFEIVQEKNSNLQIADADSDVLFHSEAAPLSQQEYESLKELVLKSAQDFHNLYSSIPNKHKSHLPIRKTFYGNVPRTAQEMYDHTKNVNSYYFGEIGIEADNDETIYSCRKRAFELLEQTDGFLSNPVVEGSYGELWSLRKVLRRFLWHDRIHAKAMYRMAVKTFDSHQISNPFHFSL